MLAAAALVLLSAASVIFVYAENDGEERAGPIGTGIALDDATKLLRELFARSPGSRQGGWLATKRPYTTRPARQARVTHLPPLQQRALGKIFDAEPVVPSFGGPSERGPFTFSLLVADPLGNRTPRDLSLSPPSLWQEYGGNPPLYFVRPGNDPGSIPPPAVMPVPEPGAWGMLLLGFGVCGSILRRRRRAQRHQQGCHRSSKVA